MRTSRLSQGKAQARVEDDAMEGPARPRRGQEHRVVGEDGADAHQHAVVEAAQGARGPPLGRAS